MLDSCHSSKLKEFADENFKFDENGREFSIWLEDTVFKRIILQKRKSKGLFGKGLSLFVLHLYFFPFYKNALFKSTVEITKC